MECNVTLKKIDLLTGEETILSQGTGHLNGTCLTYLEQEDPNIRHEITFEENHVFLKRFADTLSETDLRLKEYSMARVLSAYGTMLLETYLEEYARLEDSFSIIYQVLQEGNIVTRQQLIWSLKGVADE